MGEKFNNGRGGYICDGVNAFFAASATTIAEVCAKSQNPDKTMEGFFQALKMAQEHIAEARKEGML